MPKFPLFKQRAIFMKKLFFILLLSSISSINASAPAAKKAQEECIVCSGKGKYSAGLSQEAWVGATAIGSATGIFLKSGYYYDPKKEQFYTQKIIASGYSIDTTGNYTDPRDQHLTEKVYLPTNNPLHTTLAHLIALANRTIDNEINSCCTTIELMESIKITPCSKFKGIPKVLAPKS